MKTIFVPIDFSECSIEALKVAADISKATGAELTLIHWYYRPYIASLSPIFSQVTVKTDVIADEAYKRECEERMNTLKKEKFMNGVSCRELLIFDKTISSIFEMDEISKADLIVMGTKGADNIKEITIGSNTQKAIRNATPPTLAVKKYFDISKIKDVIFASDFGKKEGTDAYEKIRSLVKMLDARVHLLKVITPTYFEDTNTSETKIDNFITRTGLKDSKYTITVYNNYSAEEGITEFSKRLKDFIICIATHGDKGFGHFINGSIAEDLVNRVDRPILSVKK